MTEVEKSLANKIKVKNVLDLGYKNIKKEERLQTFDSSYFLSKSHFENDGTQSHSLF